MPYKRLVPKMVVSWDSRTNQFLSVLTKQYELSRSIADPVSQIQVLQSNLVDEITLICRSKSFNTRFVELVEEIASHLTTPLTVGGAIENIEDCKSLVAAGADKLIIGRSAANEFLIGRAVQLFGSQSISFSYDYDEMNPLSSCHKISALASRVEKQGFGEISLNSWKRDGMQSGVDLRTLKEFRANTRLPIVVGCGIGQVKDIFDCYEAGADAVTVSTFLATNDQPPKQIRSHLHSMGVKIRYRN